MAQCQCRWHPTSFLKTSLACRLAKADKNSRLSCSEQKNTSFLFDDSTHLSVAFYGAQYYHDFEIALLSYKEIWIWR